VLHFVNYDGEVKCIFLFLLLSCVSSVRVSAQNLTKEEAEATRLIDQDAASAVQLLERIVNINSGTYNPTGVVAADKVIEPEFQVLGFKTRWINMDAVKRAPHLVAERRGNRGKRILLIGHTDTVFEPSSPFQRFQRLGDRALAPGGSDMKGGVVILLSALKALRAVGLLENSEITVFLMGDEEDAGVPTAISRKEFIEAGKKADVALCFEGGVQRGGKDYVSTARRGDANWELIVKAKSGHSSGMFSEGAGDGAIFELSRILTGFHDMLREPNMSYSVGLVLGGEGIKVDSSGNGSVAGKDDIIPDEALARGDLRTLTPEQFARVGSKMQSIVSTGLAGTRAEIHIEDKYPPMAPTNGNKALFALRNEANRALGVPEEEELDPVLRGAGDISFVAPYVDSLSGLGAYGSGSHAPGETVDLALLPLQSKRAAVLISRLLTAPRK
jgi:glutamate carboxypeptidase